MAEVTTGGDPAECPICGMEGRLMQSDSEYHCPACDHVWADSSAETWIDVPEYASDPDAWRT